MSSLLSNPLSTLTNPALPTPASSSASSTASSLAASAPSENEFLQLLVAELKNQTPDNTKDPSQFVTELAQFAQLGESTQSTSDLDAIKAAFTSAATPPATTPPAAGTTPSATGTTPKTGTTSATGAASS